VLINIMDTALSNYLAPQHFWYLYFTR